MRHFIKLMLLAVLLSAAGGIGIGASSAEELAEMAQTRAMSLQQALELARAENPELLIGRARKTRAEATRLRTRQGFLPTISLDASYLHADFGLLENVPGIAPGIPPVLTWRDLNPVEGNIVGVQLVQPLVNLGAWHARAQAGLQENAAALGLRRIESEVVVATLEAYFGAATAQRQVTAEKAGRATAARALRQAEAAFDEGLVAPLDVLKARTRVAEMEARVALAESRVIAAQSLLRQVLGIDDEAPLLLTDTVPEPPQLVPREETVHARHDVQALEEGVKAAEAGVLRARAAYLPDINIIARYQRAEFNQPLSFHETDWLIAINLGWKLFAGFGQAGELGQARAEEQEARVELGRLQRRARAEVRNSHAAWRAELFGWQRASSSIEDAEEALAFSEGRYEEGLSDMTELLRAQAEVLAARTREINARYNALVAAQRYRLAVDDEDVERWWQ